jgi:excisionase family DNA binding protein
MRDDLFMKYQDMLTSGELSEALRVHINTVRRWANTGSLKCYRLGVRGDRRFKKTDVRKFLKSYLRVSVK